MDADDLPPDKHDLFDDPGVIDALDARGYRDIAAGRLLGSEAVTLWLGLWGETGAECRPWR